RGGGGMRTISAIGEDDAAPRQYQDGDGLHRVHWKSTARYGELMVRREENQRRKRPPVFPPPPPPARRAAGGPPPPRRSSSRSARPPRSVRTCPARASGPGSSPRPAR